MQNTQTEPTPRPWWIRKHPHDDSIGIVVAKPTKDHPYFGHSTTIDIIGDEDYPRKRADQELIVRAVTNYDKLLVALKAAHKLLTTETFDTSNGLVARCKEISQMTEAAIKDAELKTP